MAGFENDFEELALGQYRINLLSHGASDTGEVMTSDGEIIGTWQADENDHYTFFAPNRDEPLIFNPFLGLFCEKVWEWHLDQSPAP